MLKSSSKKFAVVTSKDHFEEFDKIMPPSTRWLVEDNPDLRRFLQDGIPLGTDVAVVDEDGFCKQGSSQNQADLLAFQQDLADAKRSMQIIVVPSIRRKKGDEWIGKLYSCGIRDVLDPDRQNDLEATILSAIESPASAEDVAGGYRADEPTGMAGVLAKRRAKKERKRIEKARKNGEEVRDEPQSIFEQMDSSASEPEGPKALMSGPSETQRARERLHDSGKLPRIKEAEGGVYEVAEPEARADGDERSQPGSAGRETPEGAGEPAEAETGIGPRSQPGSAARGGRAGLRQDLGLESTAEAGIMTRSQAAVLERMRAEIAREYAEREEHLRSEYEARLGEAMRSGRRQRVVAVAGASASSMTAEAALEAVSFAKAACPGCRATMFEHVGGRVSALEPYGAEPAGAREHYPDVAVHDLGCDLDALGAIEADVRLVVLVPQPWEAQEQAAALGACAIDLDGPSTFVCSPARGPRAAAIAAAIAGAGPAPLSIPNPNHFACKPARPAADLERAMGPMMDELAAEMGVEPQRPARQKGGGKQGQQSRPSPARPCAEAGKRQAAEGGRGEERSQAGSAEEHGEQRSQPGSAGPARDRAEAIEAPKSRPDGPPSIDAAARMAEEEG